MNNKLNILTEMQRLTFPGIFSTSKRYESYISDPTPARMAILRRYGFTGDDKPGLSGEYYKNKGWGKDLSAKYHENLHYFFAEIRRNNKEDYNTIISDLSYLCLVGLGSTYRILTRWLTSRGYSVIYEFTEKEEIIIALQDILNDKNMRKQFLEMVSHHKVFQDTTMKKIKKTFKALNYMASSYFVKNGELNKKVGVDVVARKFFDIY